MPPCDTYTMILLHPQHPSFNPCFSGCRPATRTTSNPTSYIRVVSILVLVDAALRLIYLERDRVVVYVSILVLVDAALRHVSRLACRCCLSFNPCFSGCRPATRCLHSSLNLSQVSILVLVDAALRPPAKMMKHDFKVFQSLF